MRRSRSILRKGAARRVSQRKAVVIRATARPHLQGVSMSAGCYWLNPLAEQSESLTELLELLARSVALITDDPVGVHDLGGVGSGLRDVDHEQLSRRLRVIRAPPLELVD